jgi:hypothetical protein
VKRDSRKKSKNQTKLVKTNQENQKTKKTPCKKHVFFISAYGGAGFYGERIYVLVS